MRHGVYVLALKHGGYYVGKSGDIDQRVQQHRDGTGSAWCRHQGGVLGEVPTVVAGSMLDVASWEMSETVAQMLMHGFENVRGWEFSSCAALSCRECDTIKTIVMGQGDLCRRCGGEGHFATGCQENIQPWLLDLEQLKLASTPPPVPTRNMIAVAAMAYASQPPAPEPLPSSDISGLAALSFVGTKAQAPPVLHVNSFECKASKASVGGRGSVLWCTRCGRDSHLAINCFAHKHFNGSELKPKSPKKA